MKKIVALVLTLVLALSLATVAFGVAAPTLVAQNVYGYDYPTDAVDANNNCGVATFHAAVAPTATENGNVAYYATTDGSNLVEVAQKYATAVLYTGTTYKYLALAPVVKYAADAGYKYAYTCTGICGQYGAKGDYVFSKTGFDGVTNYFVATKATVNNTNAGVADVLYDGGLYMMVAAPASNFNHSWSVATRDANGAALTAVCANCGAKADVVTQPEYLKAVAAEKECYKIGDAGNTIGYLVVTSGAAAADKGVSSAKTFDAGVALYAGMALMSVAGSAVVIGKKKEF